MGLYFRSSSDGFDNLIFKNHACLCCRKEIIDGTKVTSYLDVLNLKAKSNCLTTIEEGTNIELEQTGNALKINNTYDDSEILEDIVCDIRNNISINFCICCFCFVFCLLCCWLLCIFCCRTFSLRRFFCRRLLM